MGRYYRRLWWSLTFALVLAVALPAFGAADAVADAAAAQAAVHWWVWPLALFIVTFAMGVLSVLGGVGGGVLFVPIVSGFFPFHLDFVRGCGLLIAVCGSLAAGPTLLRLNLANLRLAMPTAFIASIASIGGACIGLALPPPVLQMALGLLILGLVVSMVIAGKGVSDGSIRVDALSRTLRLHGVYTEETTGQEVCWAVQRTPLGLFCFIVVGLVAGMFGLGAGWANVPVLNLIMGVPLKISVATSNFLLSIAGTSAAWVYINRGCVLPLMVAPSIIGIMLGARIGARLLRRARPVYVRWIVIGLLFFAGLKSLTKGLGLTLPF
jgi:uncharacterized membrane protein YfcA